MTETLPPRHPLRRLFEALVQETFFAKLGVPDPRLADYLADMLCRFVRMDAIFGVRDLRGRRLEEVAEMLAEASGEAVPHERERTIHKHIGDFVLFWSGVYPEFLHGGISAYLHNLFVREGHRGKGVGKSLLSAIVTEAKERGSVAIHVPVKAKNTAAIDFYRKNGISEQLAMMETRLDR